MSFQQFQSLPGFSFPQRTIKFRVRLSATLLNSEHPTIARIKMRWLWSIKMRIFKLSCTPNVTVSYQAMFVVCLYAIRWSTISIYNTRLRIFFLPITCPSYLIHSSLFHLGFFTSPLAHFTSDPLYWYRDPSFVLSSVFHVSLVLLPLPSLVFKLSCLYWYSEIPHSLVFDTGTPFIVLVHFSSVMPGMSFLCSSQASAYHLRSSVHVFIQRAILYIKSIGFPIFYPFLVLPPWQPFSSAT